MLMLGELHVVFFPPPFFGRMTVHWYKAVYWAASDTHCFYTGLPPDVPKVGRV